MKISQQQLVDLIKEELAASELNEFGQWRGAIERLLGRDPKTGKRVYAGGTEELKEGDDADDIGVGPDPLDPEDEGAPRMPDLVDSPRRAAAGRDWPGKGPRETPDERAEAEKALNKRLSSLREEDELVALQETLTRWQKIIKS